MPPAEDLPLRARLLRTETAATITACAVVFLPLAALMPGLDAPVFGALCALLMGVFSIVLLYLVLVRGEVITIPRSGYMLVPLCIVGVAVLSAVGTTASRAQLFGIGYEYGTVAFFALMALGAVSGSLLAGRTADAWVRLVMLSGVIMSIAVVGVTVFHGSFSAAGWQSVPLLIAAAMVAVATRADTIAFGTQKKRHVIVVLVLAAAFVLTAIPEAAIAAIVALITLGSRFAHPSVRSTRVPALSFVVCIVCVVALVYQPTTARISAPERPTFMETATVVAREYSGSLKQTLLGHGPASVQNAWGTYRPIEFNQTRWWNRTPTTGFSDAMSTALMFGLLGIAALGLFPASLVRMVTSVGPASDMQPAVFESAAALSMFCFTVLFLYPAGPAVLFIGSVAFGVAVRAATSDTIVFAPRDEQRIAFGVVGGLIAFVLIYTGVFQLLGMYHYARGEALVKTNLSASVVPLARAARDWPVPLYQTAAAQATIGAALAEAVEQKKNGTVDIATVRDAAGVAMRLSGFAVAGDPNSMDVMLSRAALYALVYSGGFTNFSDPSGSKDIAGLTRAFLTQAARLEPTRADVKLDQAIFAKLTGDMASARLFANEALRLMPNYEEARVFLSQLPKH